MANKKKKASKRKSDVLDTTAPPVILDLSNESRSIILDTLAYMKDSTDRNMTVSFRIHEDEYKWAKIKAHEIWLKTGEEITWQEYMRTVFLEKHPMKEEK